MNTAAKGRSREHQVRKFLESRGYWVVRAAASKGPFDLVAFDLDRILLVQSMANQWPGKIKRETLEKVRVCDSVKRLLVRIDDGAGSRKPRMRWRILYGNKGQPLKWEDVAWILQYPSAVIKQHEANHP